jgi:hypothetical protein
MMNENCRNLYFSLFSYPDVSDDNPALSDVAPVSIPSGPGPVPYPTLYAGSAGHQRKPEMGAIQELLYNIASMAAAFGAGYDVRLSNVLPIHPKLIPNR